MDHEHGDRAVVHETHVSVVVESGDRVYKLKKPVRLDFLDFRSREAREATCHREADLNRRVAPTCTSALPTSSVPTAGPATTSW